MIRVIKMLETEKDCFKEGNLVIIETSHYECYREFRGKILEINTNYIYIQAHRDCLIRVKIKIEDIVTIKHFLEGKEDEICSICNGKGWIEDPEDTYLKSQIYCECKNNTR